MAKRPSLTTSAIAGRIQPKGAQAAQPAQVSSAPEPTAARDTTRDYKTVMARMNRTGWQQLSFLSTELDRPLEDLAIEALNDLLAKYGKSPVVEKRAPPKV